MLKSINDQMEILNLDDRILTKYVQNKTQKNTTSQCNKIHKTYKDKIQKFKKPILQQT